MSSTPPSVFSRNSGDRVYGCHYIHHLVDGEFYYQAEVAPYPPSAFTGVQLDATPIFDAWSIEKLPFYLSETEKIGLYWFDCFPIARLLAIAREPNRLRRVNIRHLVALFDQAQPAFVSQA